MCSNEQEWRTGMLFALAGPTGSGKSSCAKSLLEKFAPHAQLSVSATTRAPRSGERDGEDYHFLSREEFLTKRDAGEFYEVEEIHGQLYGTLKSTLDSVVSGAHDIILDIDIRGALRFRRDFPVHCVVVFLVAPDLHAVEERIQRRALMSADEKLSRFRTAKAEMSLFFDTLEKNDPLAGVVDYFVVNEQREETLLAVESIYRAERCRTSRISRESLKQFAYFR